MSKNSATSGTPAYDTLRPRNEETQALTAQPRTLKPSQTLATNKTESICYEISKATDPNYSKKAHM